MRFSPAFRLFFMVLILGFLLSCQHPSSNLYSLQGVWKTEQGPLFYEQWTLMSDSSLKGKGFTIKGNDTLILENIRLRQKEGNWMYEAQASGQNDGQSIAFPLKEKSGNSWSFENLAHDYPNRIIYTFKNDSILKARTENTAGNKVQDFHFKRIKP